MSVVNPFQGWTALTTSQLDLDTVIPRNTYISGKTHGVTGSSHPLKFCLKCDIPTGTTSLNDYTFAPTKSSAAYRVFLYLRDPAVIGDVPYDPKVNRNIDAHIKEIKRTMSKEVQIDVSGFSVIGFPEGVGGGSVALEGCSETIIRTANGSLIKIFPNLSQNSVSDTPSWMNTPDPSPSPPLVHKAVPHGYQPITAHPVPIISRPIADRRINDAHAARPEGRAPPSDANMPASKKPRTDAGPSFPRHNGFASRKTMHQIQAVSTQIEDTSIEPPPEAAQVLDMDTEASSLEPLNFGDADVAEQVDNAGIETPRRASFPEPPQGDSSSIDRPAKLITTPLDRTTKMVTPVSRTQSSDVFQSKAERLRQTSHPTGYDLSPEITTDSVAQHTQSSPLNGFARAHLKRNQAVEAARAKQQAELHRSVAEATALRQVAMAGNREYVPIGELRANVVMNMMGVIVDHPTPAMPPRISGRDWILNVVLGDPSTHAGGPGSEGVVVTIMRPTEAELPRLHKGQAVLFEKLKTTTWNDKVKGSAYSKDNGLGIAAWAILGTNGSVKPSKDSLYVSREEIERLESLSRWWKGLSGGEGSDVAYVDDQIGQAAGFTSPGKRGEITLSSVMERDFFNATLKIIDAKVGRQPYYELYVTDGTVNPSPTHNFHGVDIGIPPSAIFTLAIFDQKLEPIHSMLTVGNFIYMRNINVKRHRGQGGLELKWSEKVTSEQKQMGWRTKECTEVSHQDYRATEINRRINELKRQIASGPGPTAAKASTPTPVSGTEARNLPVQSRFDSNVLAEPEPHLATHISTTFTDEVACPILTLSKVQENTFFPNRFRVRARVKSIHPRATPASNGEPSYICHFCNDCNRTYLSPADNLCNHCKNPSASVELRYRFIVHLQDKETEMTLLVDGKEAEEFLPPLPPIQYTDNPNDAKKQENTLKENREKVEKILLGAKMDGQRQRPIIDWTMEAYLVPMRGGKGNKGSLAAVRVFGMRGS